MKHEIPDRTDSAPVDFSGPIFLPSIRSGVIPSARPFAVLAALAFNSKSEATRNKGETNPKQKRNKTETRVKQTRNKSGTKPKQRRDKGGTNPQQSRHNPGTAAETPRQKRFRRTRNKRCHSNSTTRNKPATSESARLSVHPQLISRPGRKIKCPKPVRTIVVPTK
jgi:hypothetical protein